MSAGIRTAQIRTIAPPLTALDERERVNRTALVPHDARAVANFLLDRAESTGTTLTVMALLKIIYFAHGWYLAKYGRPLIRNAFEAWQDGPVIRAVYHSFRGAGTTAIASRAMRFNPGREEYEIVPYALHAEETALLDAVLRAYGGLSAFKLSEITHERGSPWDKVWNAPQGEVTLGMRITNDAIRQHFLASRRPSELQ